MSKEDWATVGIVGVGGSVVGFLAVVVTGGEAMPDQ